MDEFASLFALEDTDEIAKKLLGVELLYQTQRNLVGGHIVEVEAYLGEQDPGSRAYRGQKKHNNNLLYGPSGTIYMFKMYGMIMLNVVTQTTDKPEGVFIRAIEPSRGIEELSLNRPKIGFDQTNGPGKLSQALGIRDYELNGQSFNDSLLRFGFEEKLEPKEVLTLARKGSDETQPWEQRGHRFVVAGNPYVSTIAKEEIDLIDHGWN